MALANSLLYELSTNSVEQNIELVELVLHSPVHIPQKREIIISWVCKSIEDHESLSSSEVTMLWRVFHALLEDMQTQEVVIALQDNFLNVMTDMLKNVGKADHGQYVLKAAGLLLQKASRSMLSLKRRAMECMLAVTVKQLYKLVKNCGKNDDLCCTVSTLIDILISSWQQHPCTLEEVISLVKPLLGHMMFLLHVEKETTSKMFLDVQSQIKRLINMGFFHRDKMVSWLTCLSTYLKGEVCEKPLTAPWLQLILTLYSDVFSEQVSSRSKLHPGGYMPVFFTAFLDGFIAHNRTEDLQSNVVLLAFFAHHLGVLCNDTFGEADTQNGGLTVEEKLYHLNRLLQVYDRSEQYHLMVAMPQLKKSLFKPRKWFGELVPVVQSMEHTNVSWFDCLNTAMSIAPNIIEGSMVKILKKCWSVSSLGSADMLSVLDEFLGNILSTYNKLFRIPKLVRNIFSSLTSIEEVSDLHISAQFLRMLGECCTSLSPGQMTESWHLFLKQLSYWISQHRESEDPKNLLKISLVTEIFCTFLHHIQAANPTMPVVHVAKVMELMNTTSSLATEMLDFSIETELVNPTYCSLLIHHTWGELHMLLSSYRRTYNEAFKVPTLTGSLAQDDLSYLHSTLTASKVALVATMASQDNTGRVLYGLLLLHVQKVRALLLHTESTNEHLKGSLAAAAKYVFTNTRLVLSKTSWSQRISEISQETFPLASLHILLTHCLMLAPSLSPKNLHAICQFMLEVLEDEEPEFGYNRNLTQKSIVADFLKSQGFVECKPMQTAFVTALWSKAAEAVRTKKRKHDSEASYSCVRSLLTALAEHITAWEKHSETVPQPDYASKHLLSNENLNKMWAAVHHASSMLTTLMDSDECQEQLGVKDISFLLQGLQFLPLEYLFPGNQMRCLLGLFGVLFVLNGMAKERPLDADHRKALGSTCIAIATLLQGTRRSWLLDFVDSGFLLCNVVAAFSEGLAEALQDGALSETYADILGAIMREACKKKNTVRGLLKLAKQVRETFSMPEHPSTSHVTSAVVLFNRLISELRKTVIREDTKENLQKMAQALSEALESWLQKLLDKQLKSKDMFMVGSLQIQYALCTHKHTTGNGRTVCSEATLSALAVAITEILESKNAEFDDDPLCFVVQAIRSRDRIPHLLPVAVPVIWAGIHSRLTLQALYSLQCSSTQSWASLTLENCITNKQASLMETFFNHCTAEELKEVLEKLFFLVTSDSIGSASTKVHLKMLEILCSCLDIESGDHSKEIVEMVQKFIEHFSVVMATLDLGRNSDFVEYLLKLLDTLFTMKKFSPSHLTGIVTLQLLNSLDLLSLRSNPDMFCRCFTLFSRILSTFLQRRIAVVVGCTAAFQACMSLLFQGIVKMSSIENLKNQPSELAYQLQLCALSFERVVACMGSYKKEFQKFTPLLISEYVNESVNVILHAPIKKTLLFIVYKLFHLSDRHVIAMAHVTLPKEGTEVFKTLYADSQKVRFKGKV